MFVKVYEYHIREESMEEYYRIQQKAGEIYKKYIDVETTYLQSKEDSSKWMEIAKYESEEDYQKALALINQEKEIQELFKAFEAILLSEPNMIRDEDFMDRKEISNS
ncbi:hypothetical protein GLW07_09140 [Bacillus hwajinpoensis]|uniref:ABM domain-containing protein n=1 Tax=Guptibacillus hwajinpoensis TaxID=208199 RepID=A0A845EYC9_9BACL|nr:hypothetical protein [Pseudalkalibacillus hwajinpoensis]MYL63516.1 hypothetical protein [Pseudalkalibacillus hwajinpoensis]